MQALEKEEEEKKKLKIMKPTSRPMETISYTETMQDKGRQDTYATQNASPYYFSSLLSIQVGVDANAATFCLLAS